MPHIEPCRQLRSLPSVMPLAGIHGGSLGERIQKQKTLDSPTPFSVIPDLIRNPVSFACTNETQVKDKGKDAGSPIGVGDDRKGGHLGFFLRHPRSSIKNVKDRLF